MHWLYIGVGGTGLRFNLGPAYRTDRMPHAGKLVIKCLLQPLPSDLVVAFVVWRAQDAISKPRSPELKSRDPLVLGSGLKV